MESHLILCIDVTILSFRILTVVDTFLFELLHFQVLVNPSFISISGLPNFDFVSIIKCKSESDGGFIPTNHVCIYP